MAERPAPSCTPVECAYVWGCERKRETICTGVLQGRVQLGPGPGNTEIKKTKVQLLRTSQSDDRGRQVTQMTNNRVLGAGWSPEQDRAWVGQETSELISEVSQMDGGIRRSRQKE